MPKGPLDDKRMWYAYRPKGSYLKKLVGPLSRINKKRLETILHYSGIRSGARVLDLGCGGGASSVWLAELGYEVIGIDIGKSLIKLAGEKIQKVRDHVSLILGDAENLPLRGGSVNLAVSIALLHHVPNDSEGLAEMKRVVRLGGEIAISEPNALNPYLLCLGAFHFLLKRHEHLMLRSTKWRLMKIFRRLGLGGVKSENIIFTPRINEPRWLIHLMTRIEAMLEKMPLFNNLSACFVIIGNKGYDMKL